MKSVILPKRIDVLDYHEFSVIKKHIAILIPEIQVTEVGFKSGKYIGMIHVGPKDSQDNMNLYNTLSANV